MTKQRYWDIEIRGSMLTQDEMDEGWHFCCERDQMLIGMPEMDACLCGTTKKEE